MHFVDGDRAVERLPPAPVRHPFMVFPVIAQIPHPGCLPGRRLGGKGERIGFVDLITLLPGCNVVFVERARADTGDEAFPYPRPVSGIKGHGLLVPAAEIPHDGDPLCVRRPDRKIRARDSTHGADVRSKLFIEAVMRTFVVEMEIVRG